MDLQDWMDDHRRMLANLRQFEASAEHWFQFEIGGLILDRWESVCRLPWRKTWVWMEAPHDTESGRADVAVGPKSAGDSVEWSKAALLETKHIWLGPRAVHQLPGVKDDLVKRRRWNARQTVALTLCFHEVGDEKMRPDKEIRGEIKRIRRAASRLGLKPAGRGPDPYVSTRRRGEHWGYLSLGLWKLDE